MIVLSYIRFRLNIIITAEWYAADLFTLELRHSIFNFGKAETMKIVLPAATSLLVNSE